MNREMKYREQSIWKYRVGEKVLYRPAHRAVSRLDYSEPYKVVAQYVRRDRYGDFVQYGLIPHRGGEVCLAGMVKVREYRRILKRIN